MVRIQVRIRMGKVVDAIKLIHYKLIRSQFFNYLKENQELALVLPQTVSTFLGGADISPYFLNRLFPVLIYSGQGLKRLLQPDLRIQKEYHFEPGPG